MKRIISFILVLILALAAVGCKNRPDNEANASQTPTEQPTEAATEAPTEAPTAEPTPEPTEAPTPTPTATPTPEPTAAPTPEPVILAFEERAEEVLRLRPHKAYDGPLPDDAAEDEVLYLYRGDHEICDYGPLLFAVEGETTVVCDMGVVPVRGSFVYESGRLVSRGTVELEGERLAAYADGVLYTAEGAFDIESGEQIAAYSFDEDGFAYNILWTGSAPKWIVVSSYTVSGVYTISLDYYEPDDENVWQKTGPICTMVEDYYGEWTRITLINGKEFTFDGVGYEVLGTDTEGDLYLNRIANTHTVIKLSPDGTVVWELEIPISIEDRWDPELMIRLCADGTIYAAAALPEEYLIWKISVEE